MLRLFARIGQNFCANVNGFYFPSILPRVVDRFELP